MTEKQIEILEYFVGRTSMYVNPINRTSLVSFIHGFEAGTSNRDFTKKLAEYLQVNYGIYGSNEGWPRQVLLYSEKMNLDWGDAFLELCRIIIKELKSQK